METPNTRAGHLTEKIMERVTRKWAPMGKITTEQYNRIYEAVLDVLTENTPNPKG